MLAVGAAGASDVKATVVVANNSTLGAILVGSMGRSLYHFTGDHGKTVACTAGCAAEWPPVTIARAAEPVAGPGLEGSKLGTLATGRGLSCGAC